MFAEQVELPRGVDVTFRRDGFVVAADLGEVARLEFQGKLHQRLGCEDDLTRHGQPSSTVRHGVPPAPP